MFGREKRAKALVIKDAQTSFDLAHAPLFRMRLIRLKKHEYRFYLIVHHLICDGLSIRHVFMTELQACYTAFASGIQPALPPLPFQYSDYSAWQRTSDRDKELTLAAQYWKKQLAAATPLRLPAVRAQQAASGEARFHVSSEMVEALKRPSEACGATLFMTLLAAFHVLLYHHTDESDQSIGTVTSTRNQHGCEKLLGLFINSVVLRTRVMPEASFPELVEHVRETTLSALGHEIPFGTLVSQLAGERETSISSLLQVMFVLVPKTANMSAQWRMGRAVPSLGLSKSDLYLEIIEADEGLTGRFTYGAGIFDPATIRRFNRDWIMLLDSIVAKPAQSVAELCRSLRR
jgi:hypothetical protein